MIDIVIPLGVESRWEDNELRYALRAIEKYLTGFGRIFIVGNKRKWLKEAREVEAGSEKIYGLGVIFIDCEENYTEKQRSIFNKILKAAKDDRVSSTFAMWNDDHYLLQPLDISQIKYWKSGTLDHLQAVSAGTYKRVVINSNNYLKEEGYRNFHFDIHVPILYQKDLFIALEKENWEKEHIIKSLYCNRHGIKGEEMKDLNFGKPFTRAEIKKALEGRMWFSMNENGTNDALKEILQELYPEKSKWEL